MIEVMHAAAAEMFGLFELDDSGNVLYSRAHPIGRRDSAASSTVGQNFFREVAKFENREDLRSHFRQFIASRSPADNFKFDCVFGQRTVKARISMIRGHEADAEHSADIVIMDIRHDAN